MTHLINVPISVKPQVPLFKSIIIYVFPSNHQFCARLFFIMYVCLLPHLSNASFVRPQGFWTVVRMLIMASNSWSDKIMIDHIDWNDVKIIFWLWVFIQKHNYKEEDIKKPPRSKNKHQYNMVIVIKKQINSTHLPLFMHWWLVKFLTMLILVSKNKTNIYVFIKWVEFF